MIQTMYEESELIQEPCMCPPAAAAGPQNVVIREIEDPAIIAAVDKNFNINNDWAALLMQDEKKEKVIDGSDCSKSLKIKGKAPCAPRDIIYYVYVFRAQREIAAKIKEDGASKVMIFYKDDYVFVYSRHGDRFPEPDQVVIFRSDRTNRNLVDGKGIVKRFLYVRSFRTVADNCWFLGRVTCKARAVIKGTTHMVNNANRAVEVYGIVLNADKTNQKKSRTKDDPKEFNHDTLWIEYDENNAAAARSNEIVTKTFSNIQVEEEEEMEIEKEKKSSLDVTNAPYSQDPQEVSSSVCPNCNFSQNLETDKRTPVITPASPDAKEYDYSMKDTHPKDEKSSSSEGSEGGSKDESEASESESSSQSQSQSQSGSESARSECSECSEESSVSEEGSQNENENNFSGLSSAADPIYNNCVYWGYPYYPGYCGVGPIESSNSVNMGNSLHPSFEKRAASPSFGFLDGMATEAYEPFQNFNFNACCCGPVSAQEVFNPENERSEALPQDTNVSDLKRRLITVDGVLYANIDGNFYRVDKDYDQTMEEEEEMPLPPPSKKARTK